MEEILRVEDLKTYFYTEQGVVKAVDGVSFSINRKETLGIVGESGSGKTVTALSILKLIPCPPGKIINGKIYLSGRNILELSIKDMTRIRGSEISMIFQDPMTSLNPVFTVGRQIEEALVIHRDLSKHEVRREVISLLKKVGIPNPELRFNQYPHEFSGGMRQRAMIAMALACNPKVLIADEPTTALDVTIQAQIIALLNKLRAEFNTSIIIIAHDLGVIAEIADNVMIMYAGKIVEYGDVRSIFYDPHHPYTWGLLESIPKLKRKAEERLIPIDGNPPSLLDLPTGCSFSVRCKYRKEICFEKVPELKVLGSTHKVACHLLPEEIERIKLRNMGRELLSS